jgi:hypothetical protein
LLVQVDHVVAQRAGPFERGGRAFAPDEVRAEVVGWPRFRGNDPAIVVVVAVVRESKIKQSNEQQQTPGVHGCERKTETHFTRGTCRWVLGRTKRQSAVFRGAVVHLFHIDARLVRQCLLHLCGTAPRCRVALPGRAWLLYELGAEKQEDHIASMLQSSHLDTVPTPRFSKISRLEKKVPGFIDIGRSYSTYPGHIRMYVVCYSGR